MEEDQEHKKHVCKYCNQSFSSGKSLGGHMRVHLANNSNKMGSEDGGDQSGYILRDNPKKSWRFSSDSNHGGSKGEHQCRVCGKGFLTERALSGHMRHHSRKERAKNYCKECGKGFVSLKALFGHMRCHSDLYRLVDKQSEDESTSSLTMPKRPRTKRYKITANSFVSDFNASSCVAEIEPEVEEVAMILMMLSRGVRVWGAVDSITECFLGGKLLNPDKGVTENGGGSLACNGDQGFKMKFLPIETCDSDDGDVMLGEEVSEFGDLDSGIVSNEEEKVELEDTIHGFLRSDELKRYNLEIETRNELPDTEMVNEILDEVELSKKLAKERGSDRAGLESRKLKSRKKARVDAYDPELGGNSCGKMKCTSDYEVFDNNSCKKGEYSCRTCYKGFSSHQALGGHRARHHKAIKSSCVSKIKCSQKGIHTSLLTDVEINGKLLAKPEGASNSVELEHEVGGTIVTSCELKKSKVHECPICFKVFASGQALGGHMRAHCAGNTYPSEQQHSDNHDVFDVNLLDSVGEDADGRVGFKPWWVGSDNKHEQLVGLLSN